MKLRTIILLLAVSFFLFNTTKAQKWTTKAPMPTKRAAVGVAALNNKIYVIGGGDDRTLIVGTVEVYDPTNNSWETKAPMPTPRGELGVAAVNGKIYAIGGYNGIALSTVEEYDPSTNTWKQKSNMPTPRSILSVAVSNNKIYAIGGWPNGLNAVEEYDPLTDKWTVKSPLSTGKMNTNGSAAINNQVYFTGGKTNFEIFSTHEAYDPTSNTWSAKKNLPEPRWSGASVSLNNQIHFFGGTDNSQPGAYTPNYTTHFIYNSESNSWTRGLEMLNKRSNHAAVTLNGKIYILGGYDSLRNFVNWNEEYSICSDNLSIVPQNISVTKGTTATFTATTSDPNPSYIWQADFGQGFQTLNNFGNYSGANTSILSIANVQLSEHKTPIRVIANSGNCIDTSNVALINILDTCITKITINDTLRTSVTDTLIINATITGLNPPNNQNKLKIFPNPANTHITIDYGNFGIMNGYSLRIVNSSGQLVFTTLINKQTSFIDLSSWTGKGVYFLQLIDPQTKTIENKKIVVQ